VGAEPGLAPEPATDEELEWLHSAEYIATVRRFSADPEAALGRPAAGIGPGDDPAFAGMQEAAAAVAGGSIRGIEAVLRGDVEHAYHPGGGLHHAMRSRASGFCVYNDVALAIARARRDGLRVLYVDLDVHHGDGVQALHYHDPGVLTISFHESGRWLFPGTGFVDELGEESAAGTSVNVPLEPGSGPGPWFTAVRAVVPALAATFGSDIVVSQHGADGHFWDPLAHLALTTTAMGEAARLVDAVAHRYAGGRWFAMGGGGYAAYRVVPRAWALTWLAGAHRALPWDGALPESWRERWAGDAARWDDAPLPARFEDEEAGIEDAEFGGHSHDRGGRLVYGRMVGGSAKEKGEETVELVRTVLVPALMRAAELEGWWRFDGEDVGISGPGAAPPAEAPAAEAPAAEGGAPAVMPLSLGVLDSLRLAPRVVCVANPEEARQVLRAALDAGSLGVAAVAGEWLVGVALAVPNAASPGIDTLLALGVAPRWRRQKVATALIRALIQESDRLGHAVVALHTVAERDAWDPLPRAVRRGVAEKLLLAAGFDLHPAPARVSATDPGSFAAVRLPPSADDRLASAAATFAGKVGPG
jgi:acetoin utilization protein AcuC